jgi:hypothetical protein
MKSIKDKARKEGNVHSQPTHEKRRKNPDQNTMADKESELALHARPTTLAPSQHIPGHQPTLPFTRMHSLTHAYDYLLVINPNPIPEYFETHVFG